MAVISLITPIKTDIRSSHSLADFGRAGQRQTVFMTITQPVPFITAIAGGISYVTIIVTDEALLIPINYAIRSRIA